MTVEQRGGRTKSSDMFDGKKVHKLFYSSSRNTGVDPSICNSIS